MYKHAQRSSGGSAQCSVVIWTTPRGWIRCKPQQFIRHPAATFISLLYLLHKRSYVLRVYIYIHDTQATRM